MPWTSTSWLTLTSVAIGMVEEDVEQVSESIGPDRIARAREAGADLVRRTPTLTSRSLSERVGGTILLKAENLQRTGSFKLRGVLAKIAALEGEATGVVAGSAGNHAQSLAYAARARGLACEVFMPAGASLSKMEAATSSGAQVRIGGESVDECVELARERAAQTGLAFVHPFDDLDVVAGQATLGLELLEDVPDLAKVVVPLGGGGLVSGIALAVKRERPDVEIVGVQVESCAPYPESLAAGRAVSAQAVPTIADGIAIKRPGELTLPLVRRLVDGVAVVADDDVAEAAILLLERAKLVVEGAGAVGVAALLERAVAPAETGSTVAVLSGGNIDSGLLVAIGRRHETEAGRRLRLFTRVPDRPGALAGLLTCLGSAGANVIDVEHVREGVDLHVRETGVELVLETRGPGHADGLLERLAEEGYEAEVVQ